MRRIKELQDLSEILASVQQVQRIGELYAQAVGLRNDASLLEVLDAETETKMDELQSQLIEEIREIAPLRSINLETINTYNWKDHPIMNLKDPKRTLVFSEVLLRIKKIIDDL